LQKEDLSLLRMTCRILYQVGLSILLRWRWRLTKSSSLLA
jgi:hypothetical protein